ncbi:MAG: penicillin-binding protein 2 [Candidatus Saccharimonadales bacterium]|nr:penicillin-binding protein 2 [Candidatus Saccharibacteria bacterium]
MDNWQASQSDPIQRTRLWYALILIVFGTFAVRLFYTQVIRYDHYKSLALSDQIREYDVLPERGAIYAQLNGKTIPLVLNQKLYTVFADPSIIKHPDTTAAAIAPLLGLDAEDVETKLRAKQTRYVVLKKKVSASQNKKILALKRSGIASQQVNYRVYPQGTMAAQVLGFVNDDGEGKYGLEQALDSQLAGQKGRLKAITDVNGVPLAASSDNLLIQPQAGQSVTLTLDMGMQAQVESIVKAAQEKFRSKNVSALVMETNTGAIKAMANYPTFDPAKYQQVEDGTVFQNYSVASPIEPGSITKVLTVAAAIDKGSISADTSYYDPGKWTIDEAKILNVAEGTGTGTQTIKSLLNLSLNTGATWTLMQMGGGKLNMQGRQALYDYFVDHYRLSEKTGIEQGYEGTGYVPEPEDADNGINITFANMSFGQAYSASAVQMGAALSAIVNGGTYYRPTLVASTVGTDGKTREQSPVVLKKGVVSEKTSRDMVGLLDYVTEAHVAGFPYMRFDSRYSVGGKTGTAQITDEKTHLYREDVFNGTFMGYVGGDTPQYTIVVYNIEPRGYGGFAGAQTGQPVFGEIAHMLINNYDVKPKKGS